MSDNPAGGDQPKTFTQEQLDAAVTERNKALEAKRDELLGEVRGLKDKLRSSEEGYTELQQRLAALEEERKAAEANVSSDKLEEIRQAAEANMEKKYGPVRKQLEEAQNTIRKLQLDNVVKAEMGKNGVRGERVDALFRLAGDRFDLTDDGKPMLRDNPTAPIDAYISDELAKEYPEFYEGTGSSGGGAPKSTVSGGGNQVQASDNAAFLENLEDIAKGTKVVAAE